MEVVLVRWPAERQRREALRAGRVARLLLVHEGDPPEPDCLEDWVRVPAVDEDIRARVDAVRARAARHAAGEPVLDADGVLHVGDRVTPLPPVEARLLRSLLERAGAVVSREALAAAGWPDASPARNVLDVHMLRLRRRLAAVGMSVTTVRSRGYLLELESRPPGPAAG